VSEQRPKMKRPTKPIGHVFVGNVVRRGAGCRERVHYMLGDIRIWVYCGWPKSAHRKRAPMVKP